MTNQTIDLSKDLEVWSSFGVEYYDNQRNRIQDKSGYGRHGYIEGGATVGVEGYRGFGGISFDDGGHNVRYDPGANVVEDAPFSAALWCKFDNDNNPREIFGSVDVTNSGWAIVAELGGTRIQIRIGGQGTEYVQEVKPGEWRFTGFSYDGDTMIVTSTQNQSSTDKFSGFTLHGSDLELAGVGRQFYGDAALAAVWNRALTAQELRFVRGLTAPRRSLL